MMRNEVQVRSCWQPTLFVYKLENECKSVGLNIKWTNLALFADKMILFADVVCYLLFVVLLCLVSMLLHPQNKQSHHHHNTKTDCEVCLRRIEGGNSCKAFLRLNGVVFVVKIKYTLQTKAPTPLTQKPKKNHEITFFLFKKKIPIFVLSTTLKSF